MLNRILNTMIPHNAIILVSILSVSLAIRVDFNTNKGPIVPAIPTIPSIPQPPFRSPAPVWEDQSYDIPNPNPYQYVAPPPSRPRPATDNYLRAPLFQPYKPFYPFPQYQQQSALNTRVFGQVISPSSSSTASASASAINNIFGSKVQSVPSFGVSYVPNVGNKYYPIVPQQQHNNYYGFEKQTKLNGKYNPKLKKFKVYEKQKYGIQKSYTEPAAYKFDIFKQALPYQQSPQPFQLQIQQTDEPNVTIPTFIQKSTTNLPQYDDEPPKESETTVQNFNQLTPTPTTPTTTTTIQSTEKPQNYKNIDDYQPGSPAK